MITLSAVLCRFASFLLIVGLMQCFFEGKISPNSWAPPFFSITGACLWTLANYAEHVEFKKEDARAQPKEDQP